MNQRFTIRRIHFLSALKFGCLFGLITLSLPALLVGWLIGRIISGLFNFMQTNAILDLPGILPDLNLINILGLSETFSRLQAWHELGWLLVLGVALALLTAGAIWTALAALLSALLYNAVATFTGGLTITGDAIGGPALARPESTTRNLSPYLLSPTNPDRRWDLQFGRTTIGSARGNVLIMDGLAGRHAEIHRQDQRYALYDYSDGQTWVNDRPVGTGTWLEEGDTVRLGPYEFIFHLG